MRKYIPIFPILLVHIFLLSNIQFTAWPEMFSYPYLLSKGFILYKDFIHPYPPLLTTLLAFIYTIFGFKVGVLEAVTWIRLLVTDVFLYLILEKILQRKLYPSFLLVAYVILQSFLDGNMMWFDNALVLPLVVGYYFLLEWLKVKTPRNLLLSSFFFTLCAFIKQTAAIYYLVFFIFVFIISRRIKPLILIPAIFSAVFLLFLIASGALREFFNWTIYYPLTFWTKFSGYSDLALDRGEMKILLLLFAPLVFLIPSFKSLIKRNEFIFSLFIFFSSIIAIYPRFTYFHLQPTIAILFTIFAFTLSKLRNKASLVFFTTLFICAILSVRSVFPWIWGHSVRFYEEKDRTLVKMVSLLSQHDEKIFLLGLPSQIYVFGDRLPPKPWADNFGWYYEIPGFQEKVISGFQTNLPEKIFIGPTDYKPGKLIAYIKSNYYLEGEPIEGYELWRRK